ncbi:6,7-dimethyl-8-ribityllumazine synthase [Desulfocurvibacter africanus]|uniref:6,7-dimethyl-8-ribityllumazine synthase n=1 Tax=Desulfocurvibacter africanus subsp. africanus str. Walvis Bay TaxID=690850 RepID=F3YXW3_DESAF|nr:6,7-dimethyl-8-ribityllumazine synthase [Desulfocurvibacter africanus]EGJ50665.1 6,7-dimethyl-8-ribityllumazine synthase [Desulfocurvibacter africanus subsp. africanus str. Walvis Bay]
MQHVKTIEGRLEASGLKFALVATRFNDFIVDRLVGGAVDYLVRHGASKEDLTLVKLPGAFEMPLVARKLAATKEFAGVICLGAVIRGATPHFDFVAGECAKGIAVAAMETGVPIGFGVLTTDTLEQAIERAGSKGGNKGVEAAAAVLETVRVLEQL